MAPDLTGRKLYEPDLAIDEFFLNEQNIEKEKRRIRKELGMTQTEKKEDHYTFYERLSIRLHRAGIDEKPALVMKKIIIISLVLVIVGAITIGIITLMNGFPFISIILYLAGWSAVGFFISYAIVNLLFRAYLSYKMFKRKLAVEEVLPDFLRLVATNYRSGMSLDMALIKSNRPRFGIFSKEITLVAKTARVKGDLGKALEIFSKKFDSKILQRAMNNVVMSIKSGSNISELLEEIASNITKMRNMRASMVANVKNYVIFIIVAGLIIAPLMFSMSSVMNTTIAGVKSNMDSQQVAAGASSHALSSAFTGEGGMSEHDFNIFAILMLITNSIVSAFVISMIKYGNYQQGLPKIPLYLIISISLYIIGKNILGTLVTVI
jgi:pilus assembly protein TadC